MAETTPLTPREKTALPEFHEAKRILHAEPFPTKQLKMVQADIRRLHQEVSHRLDPDEPWGANNRVAARGLIVLGPNGSSKSYSIEYALASLEPLNVGRQNPIDPKVLYREAPNGEARGWLRDVLGQLGYNMARMPSPEAAMAQIESRLQFLQPTMLACDEISRVLNPRNFPSKAKLAAQAEIVWTQLIQIMSDPVWPTPVIAAGTMELRDTLQLRRPGTDELVARGDMMRRSDVTVLPPLTMDDASDLTDYIKAYCDKLGVTNQLSKKDEVGFRLVKPRKRVTS